MKTLLISFISLLILFLGGCKKDGSVYVAQYVDIAYTDNLNKDLLDPSDSNGFSFSNIRVFSLINNVKAEIYHANLTYPRDIMLYKNESLNQYFLRVTLEQDTTLLQLNPNITDTITCTIDRSEGNSIIKKVWYNGDLKWEYGKVGAVITIRK